MPIKYYPKTGEVLICDFGPDYPRTSNGDLDRTRALTSSGRLPPEMVKTRLVVVLNGRMEEGCMIVPLSSTEPTIKTGKGLYVLVEQTHIPGSTRFTAADRWAGGEQVQQVSKLRLQSYHPDPAQRPVLPTEVVQAIQRAVIKAVRAGDLLAPTVDATQDSAPESSVAQPIKVKVAPAEPASAMAAALTAAMNKKAASPALPPVPAEAAPLNALGQGKADAEPKAS